MPLTKMIMQRNKQNSINYIKKTRSSRTAVKTVQTFYSPGVAHNILHLETGRSHPIGGKTL